jgi:putative ABC transport system permease protein
VTGAAMSPSQSSASLLTPSLLAASRRYLTRHRWQTWLSIIGIALGVAVVIAVDLANESARRGFRLSVEQVTGPATHQIEAASGASRTPLCATAHRASAAARHAGDRCAGPHRQGRSMTLLGIDPIAAAPMRAARRSRRER